MKILIAYDGSNYADAAIDDLRWAGLPSVAEALVVTAVEWPLHAPRTWAMVATGLGHEYTEQLSKAAELAETVCKRVQAYFPQWDVQQETPTGSPAAAILEKAKAWSANLIVTGTHGHSALARVVLGSVSLKIAHESPCSVRIARPRRHDGPIRLLIGDDGSPEAEAAVQSVCLRAWPAGTEARVVAVHEALVSANAERIAIGERIYDQVNDDEHSRLKHAAAQAAEKLRRAGLAASFAVDEGDAKEILMREAQSWMADSVFIGARGLGRVERLLLGSVSSASVAHAPCTVEVVR